MAALADFLMDEPAIESIRLNPESKRVEMATLGQVDGELLHPGLCVVAPGDFHLMLQRAGQGYRVRLTQSTWRFRRERITGVSQKSMRR